MKLVQQGGRSVGQVAQELGLAESLVRYWMRQVVLRMEREILKNSLRRPGSGGQKLPIQVR